MPTRIPAVALAVLTCLVASRTARAQAKAEDPTAAAQPAAPPATPDPEIANLRAAIEAQQRAIADLEARVARSEEHPPEPKRVSPETSRDLVLSGYVHVDWVPYRQSSQDEVNPSSGEPLNENRILVRRARLRLETDQGLVHGALMIDANTIRGPQVRPWNAEVSLKWPSDTPYRRPAQIAQASFDEPFVILSAGLLVTPFGYDVPELENERVFLERTTMSNELIPQSYDLGLRVLGGYKFVNYALGLMNGDPIGESTFPGRDPNKSKDLTFRLGASTEIVSGLRVDVGFSGLTGRGFHKGTPPSKDQLVWRDQNEDGQVGQTELQVLPGSPATPSEGFQRFALGADARVHVALPTLGELTLRAELVRAKNLDRGTFVADPVATSRDLRELGWYVAVTQELTRWALVGVRYDTFDPDADAREQRPFALVPRDSSLSTWSFMGTLRYKKARLVAEYDHRKNALGRDVTGAPTTLADDSFTLRAVVGF
jgi:hypothetical protein